jgi:preprotein translocase subunit SecA
MVKNMMGTFGIPEDQPIENSIITNALERAQKKIEGFNFDARRQVLKYDDVLDKQRKTIYKKRDRILEADNDELEDFVAELAEGDEDFQDQVASRRKALEDDAFFSAVRKISLQTIDTLWVEHLDTMEQTKQSVRLRSYGKEDPAVEYKKEGKKNFETLLTSINEQIKKLIPKVGEGEFNRERKKLQATKKQAQAAEKRGDGKKEKPQPKKKDTPTHPDGTEIGRNDKVIITKGGKEKTIKYKKAQLLIENDGWSLQGSARNS